MKFSPSFVFSLATWVAVVLRNAVLAIMLATAVHAAALSITTQSVPAAGGGVPYAQTLAATVGVPPYAWSVQAVGLTACLSLSAAGAIGGTPSTSPWVY